MSTATLDKATVDKLRSRASGSLYFFAKAILGYDWLTPHVHLPICKILEDYENKTRVKVVLPRGWLKSTLCSIAYPLWRAVRNPNIRVLLVQNTHSNACKKLAEIRGQVIENQLFRTLYPELLPTKNSTWKADALCLTRPKSSPESTFEAAGTQTAVTSRHYELIIEDDTVAPDLDDLGEDNLAPTKDDVVQAIGWHRLASPLLVNPSTDQILVVGTRWFEKDLMSWIDENADYYSITRAVRENEQGVPDERGSITYPERFSEKVLSELAADLGPYMYSCLYMNKPIRGDDMIFKDEWFQFYEMLPKRYIAWTTVDPATDPTEAKSKDTDFSVVLTCVKDMITGLIYVAEYTRKRCNPGDLISAIFEHVRRWKPVEVGFEDVSMQRNFLYWIRERMRSENLWFNLKKLPTEGRSKEARIIALQPIFSSQSILLRVHMKELQHELLTFPYGAHDDVADCLAMQLKMWQVTKSSREQAAALVNKELSLDAAIEQIENRSSESKRLGPSADILKTVSSVDIPEGAFAFSGFDSGYFLEN